MTAIARTASFDAPQPVPPTIPPTIPPEVRRGYFRHLYWDIAWYGLLAGSSLAFVSIYITRLGATPWQIGLLNAGPALVGLFATMPLGRWLQNRTIGRAVLWSAILHRILYLPWIWLPLALPASMQIWAYIILTLVMTVPGTSLSIGFNALYASAVPIDDRGQVAGVRNALLAIVYVATTLACGFLLNRLPLAQGYALVFALGFLGAFMSTVHVWFLRRITGREDVPSDTVRAPLLDHASPGSMRFLGINLRSSVALRVFARTRTVLRPEILRTPYGLVVASLLFFHFAQYIPIALFPIMWVKVLRFTDQQIGIGTAVFHLSVLIGSLQLGRMTARRGNLWLIVVGVFGLSLYPLLVANTYGMPLYLLASAVGGVAWAMVGGALANYLLDLAPAHDRPAYLAWYNVALNGGILAGSLTGPLLANSIGIRDGLLVGFGLRFLAAIFIWFAGRRARAAQPAPA